MTKLTDALKKDPELQIAYQANIAMAFKDAAILWRSRKVSGRLSGKDFHIIGNAAASYFVDLLCDNKPFSSEGGGLYKMISIMEQYLDREANLKQ